MNFLVTALPGLVPIFDSAGRVNALVGALLAHNIEKFEYIEIYYIPSLGIELGFELGIELEFELGIELGFELGIVFGFDKIKEPHYEKHFMPEPTARSAVPGVSPGRGLLFSY